MTKQLLAGVAAFGLMSGVAFAQSYPPAPPPVAAPQSVGVPGSTTTTTTVAPTTGHTTTITKGVDANGNEITKKYADREGTTGSSETHTKTFTDPDGGTTTTRSKTTTKEEQQRLRAVGTAAERWRETRFD
jgi:hypothetical protein